MARPGRRSPIASGVLRMVDDAHSEPPKVGALPPQRSWRRRLRRALLRFVGVLVGTTLLGLCWGYLNAWTSKSRARAKLAVRVEYPGRRGQAEFLYGPFAGASVELRGHDTSVWLDPELLEPGGPLRSFYQALAQLEDRDVETGLGINPRGLGRAVITRGASGGSSLHDQACDAMEDGFAPTMIEQLLPRPVQRVINKLDNTLCGIGLARQSSPTEVVALYATYGYLGSGAYGIDSFARIYWRFDGIEDPRLSVGHQLVLAALFNKPWTSDASHWTAIKQRARHALDLLIAAELISAEQRRTIARQIDRAKPLTKAELDRRGLRRRLPRPPASMAYPVYRAAREAEDEFGRDWRTAVAQLELSVDRDRQARALAGSKLDRGLLDQRARVTMAVVNERGEYLVLHTGTSLFDESDRIHAMRSPGSVTKLLVAAGLARAHGSATRARSRPGIRDVQEALRRSNSEFFPLASGLGVDPGYVGSLIECYGDAHSGARENLIEDSAKGALEASPAQLLAILQDAHFGAVRAMPEPHVVRNFVLRDGGQRARSVMASVERQHCAELIHNGGATSSWFEIPMRGTMIAAQRRVDVGKTGSVGRSTDSDSANADVNYWTLAIGGRALASGYETGIVVLGADAFFDQSGNDLAIVGLEQASRSAVPLLAKLMTRSGKK